MRYRNIAALPIPADFPIPTCGRCAAEYLNRATCERLAPLLLCSYQAALRSAAATLITAATANISQRRIEAVLKACITGLIAQCCRPKALLSRAAKQRA